MPIVGDTWKKQIDKDLLRMQAGTLAGLKQYVEIMFARILADGFVEGAIKEINHARLGKVLWKLETKDTNLYSSPRRVKLKDGTSKIKQGRRVYAKNKFVSRTGDLRSNFVLGGWSDTGLTSTALSVKPGCKVVADAANHCITITLDGNAEQILSKYNGKKTRIKLESATAAPGNPTRRPIVERANSKASRFYSSVLKKNIDAKLK